MDQVFALLDDSDATAALPCSRLYTKFVQALVCQHHNEFDGMLATMQQLVQNGLHAVGIFTYELGERAHGIDASVSANPLAQILLFARCDRLSAMEAEQWLTAHIGGDTDTDPLDIATLTALQTAILGHATRYGLRRSPVFVGHTNDYAEIVDYVAPHWDDTISLLGGLQQCLSRTRQRSSILRAAVASFGFVYIHPMADGNGRISRFLVNDILRRDGALPEPYILPISATITSTAIAKTGYDRALETLSKPLLAIYKNRYAENVAGAVRRAFDKRTNN